MKLFQVIQTIISCLLSLVYDPCPVCFFAALVFVPRLSSLYSASDRLLKKRISTTVWGASPTFRNGDGHDRMFPIDRYASVKQQLFFYYHRLLSGWIYSSNSGNDFERC